MEQADVVLCELAELCLDSGQENLLFAYGEKQWRIKEELADNAIELIEIITNFASKRTKKLRFRTMGTSFVLLQLEGGCDISANAHDMQLAVEMFPIIFSNYTPTLEFEVLREHHQRQRELKSYVTTQLYNALYCKHQEQSNDGDAVAPLSMPSYFKSQLRQYQQRTVNWMLNRERELHKFTANYTLYKTANDKHQVYKHNYCLQFYKYEEEETMPTICLPTGGILADEMGLGKTVELLATLLLNPKTDVCNTYWLNYLEGLFDSVPLKKRCMQPKIHCICIEKLEATKKVQCLRCQLWQHQNCVKDTHEHYVCPNCWTQLTADCQPEQQLVDTGATIIVSPKEIKTQWYHEISKHIEDSKLKVLLYPGLHSGVWYSPMELAKYDIVLTDYTILVHEINHTPRNTTDREMRYEQRYMRPSSPLLMVKWWRVCLDEAQMVESNTSKAAQMVSNLPAVHRWAITGTPIQKTIDDLAPLLKFVGFREACEPLDAWLTVANSFLLSHKVEPLLDLLQHCMWRTCKSKVEHELGIPPQSEVVHYLDLSNVESLYYREEHFKCTSLFLKAVAKHTKYDPNASSSCLSYISPILLRSILQPFLRIRKTCSVPVVLHKNFSDTSYLNRQELLQHLKTTNEVECKSELRTWASSYNGIAAISFIHSNYKDAIHNYKQVLKLASDYNEEHMTVDSLLQIHALHNMLQASNLAPSKDKLSSEEISTYNLKLNTLERKYLEATIPVMQAAEMAYESKLEELDKLDAEFESSILKLFATLMSNSETLHDAVWNKINYEFFRHNISTEKLREVSSMLGIVYLLQNWHDRLQNLRKSLRHDFEFLQKMMFQACGAVEEELPLTVDSIEFIKEVSDCHLAEIMEDKPASGATNEENPKRKRFCRLCKIRDAVNQFECLLFAKELDKAGTMTDGSENPSWEIIILKVVFAFLSTKIELRDWKTECKNKLEQLDCLLSLAKLQIKYWIEVEYVIKTFDELDMCKMRISLTNEPEEVSNFRLLPNQLDEQFLFNQSNIKESQLNFIRLLGRLKYLKHLEEDSGDKPCPICQTLDDERYVMMSCGHFLCQHCLEYMKKQMGRDKPTKCPICRQISPQLYYSVRKGNSSKVIGDFSTKISCIVEQVMKIQAECAGKDEEKILIFSQWANILDHIAHALQKNGIKYRNRFTNRDIDEFKQPELKITCMLMPISRGSKGLNLIEARHVFLVEPILTPGEELQAIGRVHRFGQTKPTTVHRFIVNDTIEENIMKLIKSADDRSTLSTHWDLDNMTLDSLKDLFTIKGKHSA
ncbi:hypothetical protein ACLKA7_017248 [Drosophila subpalustris]